MTASSSTMVDDPSATVLGPMATHAESNGMNEQAGPAGTSETIETTGAARSPRDGPKDTLDETIEEVLPILPKGIVANTAEIYTEVASYDRVPLQRLQAYWRVYTVTHRRLYDPTASRLESFWWHVWGSNCRNLSGKTLAKHYKNISQGPTFVPLRGPPNRYEGPTIPPFHEPTASRKPKSAERQAADQKTALSARDTGKAKMSEATEIGKDTPGPSSRSNAPITSDITESGKDSEASAADHGKSRKGKTENAAQMKQISASSLRPAPPQSILKKPRPSLNGPRPTPRFALPSEGLSEVEEHGIKSQSAREKEHISKVAIPNGGAGKNEGKNEGNNEPETAHAGGLDPQQSDTSDNHSSSPTKGKSSKHESRKPKAKHAKKKFVVSSSALKRKTVVAKRPGTHTAVGSSGSSEAVPGLRDMLSHVSTAQLDEILVEEEGEKKTLLSPIPSNPEPEDAAILGPPSARSQQPTHRQAMSAKATGKQRAHPQGSNIRTETPSPASTSTTASGTAGTKEASAMAASVARSQRPALVRQTSGPVASSDSLTRPSELSLLKTPMTSRSRTTSSQPPFRPSVMPPPRRQHTLPTDFESSRPVLETQLSDPTMMGNRRLTAGRPPALPIQMARSMSQDGYGFHLGSGGLRSPLSSSMNSTAIATPSMVAVSGVFSEAEAPDPFEVYARTGLADRMPDERPTDRSAVEGTSYTEHNPQHRPQFTPTRPSQTPRIPFARTRSQLNIILDREKERLGEDNFASWRQSRSRDHSGDDSSRSGR